MSCRKYKNILQLSKTFLKSPADKKYRISIDQYKSVFIDIPIVFFDSNNTIELVPASFIEILWKKLTEL